MSGKRRRGSPVVALSLMFALLITTVPTVRAFAAGMTVMLKDSSITIPQGGSRQLTATVSGVADTSVTWSVNGITGGDATAGTISTAGNYVSPSSIAVGTIVTIKATSVADPTAYATCSITIRNQIPYITSITPNPLPPGPFTITVNGSRYVSGAQVLLNSSPLPTKFISSTQLTATGNFVGGSASVNVVNPGPAGAISVNYTLGANTTPTPTPTPVPTPTPKPSVSVSPSPVNVQIGGTQQFQATVSNISNTQVNWSVNSVAGGNQTIGTIDTNGFYTAPASAPYMGVVTITAVSAANASTKGTASLNLQDPQAISVGRFLEQSTFGPTPQLMTHVRQVGFNAFLDEQFMLPESPWPDYTLPTTQRQDAVNALFYNAGAGADQLRQRVLYALSQIWVVSLNKNVNADMIIPHLQILSKNAFGNYRTLMREMTLSSSMGMYLDLVNSVKPGPGGVGANENYPRELMQLFTIGLWELNSDGSQKLDAGGQAIPTYTQADVQQLARALTGWTYPTPPGKSPNGMNYNYQPGVMEARPAFHDTTQKNILGKTLAANQTITQDLDGALDIIFNHPNLGPFLATRLIRALVTSNPSPAYIQRVTAVFDDNGQGTRGDMQAVIRAVLLDPEARNDAPPSDFGKLKSPMLYVLSLMRALQSPIPQQNLGAYIYYSLGEGMLDPPSVFGHYSPLFRIPKTQTFGPEFQIYSPTEAVNRGNFIYQGMSAWNGGIYDITPFISVAGDQVQLVNAVDNALLFGRMLPSTRASIYKALQVSTDSRVRALTALYLCAMSGEYLVQH
ncbi:MAG: hypothetical protein QOH63_343 [Acidobacteriota bacterium]|nr:hypothetical protein [Acidobacteriota bacterium]